MELILKKIGDACILKGTFMEYSKQYVQMKENVLSPRTVREYLLIPDRLPRWFVGYRISDITQEDIQMCVNELSATLSPKTVRTYHGFITAVFGTFRPQMVIDTTLPQKRRHEPYIPSEEDIKKILDYSKDTQYDVALKLACLGLRRSEICCLEITDLDENDVIHINKALVEDKNNEWIVKPTKTTMSEREVPIPHDLAEKIRRQGYVFNQAPSTISNYLRRTQDKLGMEHFSVHKMRHFFASRLMDMGVGQKDIMSLGGWVSNTTVMNIYQHKMRAKTEEGRREISETYTKDLWS